MRLAVYRATLAEAVGRKVVTWGLIASAGFIALFALAFHLLYRQMTTQLMTDQMARVIAGSVLTGLGLYVASFLAAFLAMTLASGSVGAEADAGVLQAVVVRPLPRWQWFLQRWAGFATLAVIYVTMMTAAILLVARLVADYRPLSVFGLIALLTLQVVFLLTVGMLLSCRLSAMATGVVLFFYFGIAWLGGFVGFVGEMAEQSSLVQTATAVSLLAPSDALWKAASHFAAPKGTVLASFGNQLEMPFMSFKEPSTLFLCWAVLLTLLVLAGGLRAFSRRDL